MHELEDWVGELSAAQRERIREFSERAPTANRRLRDVSPGSTSPTAAT
jgi:hypothetical protein